MYSSFDFNKSLSVFVYAYTSKIGMSFVTVCVQEPYVCSYVAYSGSWDEI